MTVRTLAKGQVVIPAQIRKKLSIEKGSLLQITLVEDHIELRPLPHDPIEAFCGSLPAGDSLAKELMDEHKQDMPDSDASEPIEYFTLEDTVKPLRATKTGPAKGVIDLYKKGGLTPEA